MKRFADTDHSASRFTQRVRLERPVISQDSLGDSLYTWLLVAEVWADVQPHASGGEEYRHATRRGRHSYDVFLRYRDDVKSNWRVVLDSRVLHILRVIDVAEERVLLKLKVEERE